MRYGNFGCGYDIKSEKDGWINVDKQSGHLGVRFWDMAENPPDQFVEWFDFALVNHVLCTMNDYLVHKTLINVHRCLKPGAKLQVIDMDILKVFQAYQEGRKEDIPIEFGEIDDRLCEAISGYGTRDSLYTPKRMARILESAGFRVIQQLDSSEYDTRPKESLVFEATK